MRDLLIIGQYVVRWVELTKKKKKERVKCERKERFEDSVPRARGRRQTRSLEKEVGTGDSKIKAEGRVATNWTPSCNL